MPTKIITKKKYIIGSMILSTQIGFAGTMGDVKENAFNGAYIGLGTGVLTNLTTNTYTTTNYGTAPSISPSIHDSSSGVMFSGNIGYGKNVYENVYLGAKASILYTPINTIFGDSFSVTPSSNLVVGNNDISTSFKPIYNINAVIGYEIKPRVLPFVEGGVSFTGIDRRYVLSRTFTNLQTSSNVAYSNLFTLNKYTTGYNIGLGANYRPESNWMFSGELMYFGFGKISDTKSFSIPANNLIGTTLTNTKGVTLNTLAVFATVSYFFA